MVLLTDDEIVQKYAYTPKRPPGYKVKVGKWPCLPSPQAAAQRGRDGLDRLPTEVLDAVVVHLDIQSLTRFARTSRRNAEIALTCPEYGILFRHARQALGGLGELSLLSFHTARELYNVLTSDKCTGCGRFGAFFYALEAERCCWMCAAYDTRFWAVPYRTVVRYYKLSHENMHDIPIARHDYETLISARATTARALQVHGSEAQVRSFFHQPAPRSRHSGKPMHRERKRPHIWAGDPILWKVFSQSDAPRPWYRRPGYEYPHWRNATHVRFPYLNPEHTRGESVAPVVDMGFWCPGCRAVAFGGHLEPEGVRQKRERYLRERCRADFVAHVRSCENLKIQLAVMGEESFRSMMKCGE